MSETNIIAMWSSGVIVLVGVLLILGTRLGWRFLVDPQEEWALVYSHSALKKLLGADFLVGLTGLLG